MSAIKELEYFLRETGLRINVVDRKGKTMTGYVSNEGRPINGTIHTTSEKLADLVKKYDVSIKEENL